MFHPYGHSSHLQPTMLYNMPHTNSPEQCHIRGSHTREVLRRIHLQRRRRFGAQHQIAAASDARACHTHASYAQALPVTSEALLAQGMGRGASSVVAAAEQQQACAAAASKRGGGLLWGAQRGRGGGRAASRAQPLQVGCSARVTSCLRALVPANGCRLALANTVTALVTVSDQEQS
jgi:hypothetical protein